MKARELTYRLNKLNMREVVLKNGAKLYIFVEDEWHSLSRRKANRPNGHFTWIHTMLSAGCIDVSETSKYKWSSYGDFDYILPERVLNILLNANGGVDEYRTFTIPQLMQRDMEALMQDFNYL